MKFLLAAFIAWLSLMLFLVFTSQWHFVLVMAVISYLGYDEIQNGSRV